MFVGEHAARGPHVQTTLVDDAELIWRLAEKGYKQLEISRALGWSRTDVANHLALRKIATAAWQVIVTTFMHAPQSGAAAVVTDDVTTVTSPFTERILREILDLTPAQQLELCTEKMLTN